MNSFFLLSKSINYFLNIKKKYEDIFLRNTPTKIYKLILIIIIQLLLHFINLKEKILNNKYISHPKISIFLPIYNKANYLKRSIGSIQNQTIKEIEIIPINDASEDNSLEILNDMAKNDSRIKIINNDKNRGLLYSRTMGIINSKGEYLINLDPDDEFESIFVLEYLYKIAMKSKTDVVSFGHLIKNSLTSKKSFKCTYFWHIQTQPKIFNLGNEMLDFLITDKLIKREIFLKAYEFFKPKIFGEKWNYAEDEIWSSLINKYANSKICTNKIAYIYYSNNDSLTHNKINILYLSNLISWFEMFQKIYDKKEYKKYLLNHIFVLINIFKKYNRFNKLTNIIVKNTTLKEKYISIFNYINYNYISNINTTFLINILSSLKA